MRQSKSNRYKITVITVCRNAGDVIEKTIQSVVGQDYDDMEYIIVDGASTDHTMSIVKKYAEYYPIKYVSEKDSGIYNAMNKGIRMSTGDYIIFENAGDIFYDCQVISDIVRVMKNRTADIYYGNWLKKYPHHTVERREDRGKLKILLQGYMPVHQCIFSSSRLLKRYPFDESYRIIADLDWFLKCKKNGARFCYIDRMICIFDGMGVSNMKRMEKIKSGEQRRCFKKHYPVLYFLRNLWL